MGSRQIGSVMTTGMNMGPTGRTLELIPSSSNQKGQKEVLFSRPWILTPYLANLRPRIANDVVLLPSDVPPPAVILPNHMCHMIPLQMSSEAIETQ